MEMVMDSMNSENLSREEILEKAYQGKFKGHLGIVLHLKMVMRLLVSIKTGIISLRIESMFYMKLIANMKILD